jgi:cysteine desulfurase
VFEACEGETLVLKLDYNGVCASSGSACSSASLDPSHVLLAAGLPQELAHGSLRLSLSHNTSDEDVAYLIRVVTEAVASTRALSPLWDGGKPTVQF